jgi:Tol biopolymer transport system component
VVEVIAPEEDTSDLWLVDLQTGLQSRYTFDPGVERNAIWTPDGREIVYSASLDRLYRIMRRPVEGTGEATVPYESRNRVDATSVHPDGTRLLFTEEMSGTDWDLFLLSLETGEVEPLVVEDGIQAAGMISPDGRWFAHVAETPNNWEILVRPLSGGDRRWQIDRDGGVYPFWSLDGGSLLYIGFYGEIQRVPVDGSGPTFRISGPPERFAHTSPPEPTGSDVSLHPDGERVLHVRGRVSEDETGYMQLVTDWRRGLAR